MTMTMTMTICERMSPDESDNNFHECSLYWTIMFSTPKVAMFSPSFFRLHQSSRVVIFLVTTCIIIMIP